MKRITHIVVGLSLVAMAAGCNKPDRPYYRKADKDANNSFYIGLRKGFNGGQVQVYVDGVKIYQGNPVTDTQKGLAESISYRVKEDTLSLKVVLASQGLEGSRELRLNRGPTIYVSVVDGKVEITQESAGPSVE
jgi:hypothetical protein